MRNYILIDGSYFIFYRVFALQIWWKNAKPEDELTNPFTNEKFKEKYIETFLLKINEIKRKLSANDLAEGMERVTDAGFDGRRCAQWADHRAGVSPRPGQPQALCLGRSSHRSGRGYAAPRQLRRLRTPRLPPLRRSTGPGRNATG